MFSHRTTASYADEGGPVTNVIGNYNGQNEVGFDGTIAPNTTDQAVPMLVSRLNLQSLVIFSSTALTIKTNSSTTPAQTLTLAAGQQIMWGTGTYYTNPITADITNLYLTNGTANPATVKIRFLLT